MAARRSKDTKFTTLLREQVQHEFTAHQQYVALAVWFDGHDLPQLAAHFYRQALEERNHAMMLIRYMLDREIPVEIPSVDAVRNEFSEPRELIALALQQEKDVTAQIEKLFHAARDDGDVIAEQYVWWFLKEQVEEVAQMSTLLQVAERSGDQPMWIEDFLARETIGDSGADAQAPSIAGPRV